MAFKTALLRRGAAIAVVAALGPVLGGCWAARETTGSVTPHSYRDRHPITLADTPRVLDVFVVGAAGLDPRQRQDVQSFLTDYKRTGNGPLIAQVPSGVWNAAATQRTLSGIRQASGSRLAVSRYEPDDPSVASPIRLSFRKLQAQVASKCGLWPQDLGVSDLESASNNDPYWNFGCANQANFAAQVAEPLDLVRPRRETPPDTLKRMYGFEQLRTGQDPSTVYRQDGQNKINQTLGN
jgi:pilus assembly protein CpaD